MRKERKKMGKEERKYKASEVGNWREGERGRRDLAGRGVGGVGSEVGRKGDKESHVALGRRALPTILRMEQRIYFCLVLNAYKYSYHFELRPTPIYASRRAGFERSPRKQMHI